MNLLLLEPSEIQDGVARLSDRRADHLRQVLQVAPGRRLRLGIIDGGVGWGEVRTVDPAVEIAVMAIQDPPPRSGLDLVVALPRPQALQRILQAAATLRVDRLDLVNAWRVEKSFFSSPALAPATIRRHLLLGAEQGMTPWLPAVQIHRRLLPFLAERFPRATSECRLLAHPEAPIPLELGLTHSPGARRTLAIGPEGGWIPQEVATFSAHGFRPVALGPWILRVETALVAALAQLALLERWRPVPAPQLPADPLFPTEPAPST